MTAAFVSAASLEEALAAMGAGAVPVAGGTDLVVGARQGKAPLPESLVAIHRIEALRGIVGSGGGVRLGALATHEDVVAHPVIRERFTALADACAIVGSPATRAQGTIGGNLANASPANEAGSPLLCFDAAVELASKAARRILPLSEFFRGPGQTARSPGELLVAVDVPSPPGGSGSAYLRLEYRRAMEIAVVGAAALLALDGDRIADARLAITAVGPVCMRVPAAEALLRGVAPTEEGLRAAADEAAAASRPIDDVRASAEYRRAMVSVIVQRALRTALRRARGEAVPIPANLAPESA